MPMPRPVGGPVKPIQGPVPIRPVGGPVLPKLPARPIGGPAPRSPGLPVYHKGGIVKKTGPALVQKGEKIIPAKKAKKK